MSFLQPEPLLKRQKWAAVIAVLLMLPVFLDVFKIIDLGAFKMAPFFLLMIAVPFTWKRRKTDGLDHG